MKLLLSIVLTAAILGCGGSDDDRVPTVPVKGKLTIDGKPSGPVKLTFVNNDKQKQNAGAVVDASGEFQPTTYDEHDGIPEGEYTVAIAMDTLNPTAMPQVEAKSVSIKKPESGSLELTVDLKSTGKEAKIGIAPPGGGGSAPMGPPGMKGPGLSPPGPR